MARRIRTDRVIALLGGAVLLLGVIILWRVLDSGGFDGESRVERVRTQLADFDATLHLFDMADGRTPGVVCGYAGVPAVKDEPPRVIRFVARPNRLMTSLDPLPVEFREQIARECPRYFDAPPRGVN